MPDLTVSVVIPTYKRAHLIGRALDSVLPQLLPGDEVIVADDGSDDDTASIVSRLGGPVRFLELPHRGVGATRNSGIAAATGDLVALLDSDDEWMPGSLALRRAVMAALPDLVFLFTNFGAKAPSGRTTPRQIVSWNPAPDRWAGWDEVLGPATSSSELPGLPPDVVPFDVHVGRLYESYFRNWAVNAGTTLVRRELAGDAFRFPEDLPSMTDLEAWGRLSDLGPVAFLDCDTMWQHRHEGPQLTDRDLLETARIVLTVLPRVWGSNPAYLARHRQDYEACIEEWRDRMARELLVRGRAGEARAALRQMESPPAVLRLLARAPGWCVRLAFAAKQRLHRSPDRGG